MVEIVLEDYNTWREDARNGAWTKIRPGIIGVFEGLVESRRVAQRFLLKTVTQRKQLQVMARSNAHLCPR